jgi:hypothetical protein
VSGKGGGGGVQADRTRAEDSHHFARKDALPGRFCPHVSSNMDYFY